MFFGNSNSTNGNWRWRFAESFYISSLLLDPNPLFRPSRWKAWCGFPAVRKEGPFFEILGVVGMVSQALLCFAADGMVEKVRR